MIPRFLSLRLVLLVDGLVCLLMGAGLILLAGPFAELTYLPRGFLLSAGIVLLPVATLLLWLHSRRAIPAAGLTLVVVGNAAWALASLVLPVVGAVTPNTLGSVLMVGQGVVVGVVALVEWRLSRTETMVPVA